MTERDVWLHCPAPRPDAGLRVYAFGHAGAGAAAWNAVARQLPESIELCAFRLGGRERRYTEPAPRTVADAVVDVGERLVGVLAEDGRPFAVAGVCSGALLGFELVRWLRPVPVALVVFNHRAPHVPPRGGPGTVHLMAARDMFERLRSSGAIHGPLASDPSIFAAFEPTIRADHEAAETYVYRGGPPVGCPILPVHGDRAGVAATSMAAWPGLSTVGGALMSVSAPHNVLPGESALVAATLTTVLAAHQSDATNRT